MFDRFGFVLLIFCAQVSWETWKHWNLDCLLNIVIVLFLEKNGWNHIHCKSVFGGVGISDCNEES